MLRDVSTPCVGDVKQVVATEAYRRAISPGHQPALGQRHAGWMIRTSRAGHEVRTVLAAAPVLIDAECVLQDAEVARCIRGKTLLSCLILHALFPVSVASNAGKTRGKP